VGLRQTTEVAKPSCMKGNFSKYRQKDKKNTASEQPGIFPLHSLCLWTVVEMVVVGASS